jgi:type VI secretion system protein ImpL
MSPRRILLSLLAAAGLGGGAFSLLRLGVPMTTLLLAVIGLLIVAVGALARSAMKARRTDGGIEGALKAQAEREAAAYTPDRRAEVERMRESFDQAVARLKASSLAGTGPFKSGKKALYALPWYLFVGPPGAGKTTALLQSGLRFPGGAERVRGVGGTRNCDWFFSDQAILVDTAGRYTSEDEDQEEWLAFLDALRTSRPDRPVNGVIVGVAAPDLLGASPRELEDQADDIRRRIDELVERLGLRLPVYLMVTKADLVPGFVEFFGAFDRDAREQAWGATLEPYSTADPVEVVEREFDLLVETLRPHRNARLAQPLRREERQRIYGFPLEFAALRDRLARLAGIVFAANPLDDGALFRGFYFTSGTQEGAPIDRVIGALAAQFGLAGPPPAPPPVETKSYFLKDVFTDIVIPDRHLARRTRRAAGATWRALTKAGVAALAVAALAAVLLGAAAASSSLTIRRAADRTAEAAQIRFSPDGARATDLTRLESLREEMQRLQAPGPLRRALLLGLDRSATLREPVEDVYYTQARSLVATYALVRLRATLTRARTFGQADSTGAGEATAAGLASRRMDIENDLEAYLLLTTHADSLASNPNLRDALKARLAELTPRGALGADAAERQQSIDLVVRQTDAFVDGLAAGRARPFEADRRLVSDAMAVVDVPPTLDGLYERIRREALARLPPLALADAVPEEHLGLFAPAGSVPGFFTKGGWERVVRRRFQEASLDPAGEYWMLGRTADDLPEDLRNADDLYARMEARYQREYVAAWERFLTSVRYKAAEGADAEARLAILGSSTDSPIGWLLSVATEQTTFAAPPAAAAARGLIDRAAEAIGREAPADSAAAPGVHPITAAFAGIHRLNAPGLPTGEADPGLYQALEALAQFGRRIVAAAGDRAAVAELLAVTKDEIETGTRGLDRVLRQNLFFAPLDISQRVATAAAAAEQGGAAAAAAQEKLDEAREAFSDALAGRYPFDPASSRDAALDDARAFFGPGGALETLAQGVGSDASPDLRTAIEKGRKIGAALFGSGSLTFRMQPDLPTYSSPQAQRELAVDAVAVGIHGTNAVYRLGSTRWTDMAWPGPPGAYVTVQRRDGALSREFDGDWAVFRLFQSASVRPIGGTRYNVAWTFRDGANSVTVRYELSTTAADSPLADPRGFFQFSLPRSAQ